MLTTKKSDKHDHLDRTVHQSVLLEETLGWLAPHPGGRYIDATLGGAGHTERLLAQSAPDGLVLGIDADQEAIDRARRRLPEAIATGRLQLRHGNFDHMEVEARALDIAPVDGILLDLGLSSDQLASSARGFSFAVDAPLDMRFDTTHGQPVSELVNQLDEVELANLIYRYGEERHSRTIGRRIVKARQRGAITSTAQLAEVVRSAVPKNPGQASGIDPATRTFQALRIAVNDELGSLERVLPQAVGLLAGGGRLAVISFHSLEDRIVKQAFLREERGCICPPQLPVCVCGQVPRLKILTRHPVVAGEGELAQNPRARSAKLRVAERLPI
jgi:16S rRNA (cytosine1402-N4)-methyltransferase